MLILSYLCLARVMLNLVVVSNQLWTSIFNSICIVFTSPGGSSYPFLVTMLAGYFLVRKTVFLTKFVLWVTQCHLYFWSFFLSLQCTQMVSRLPTLVTFRKLSTLTLGWLVGAIESFSSFFLVRSLGLFLSIAATKGDAVMLRGSHSGLLLSQW